MKKEKEEINVFTNVAHGRRGDFLLHFYAAIYRLLYYLDGFTQKGKEGLEDVFKKFPFLSGYYEEIRQFMPGEITREGALEWWRAQISAWEENAGQHLPLQAVTRNNGLTYRGITALMLVGLVEEDSRLAPCSIICKPRWTSAAPAWK